MITFRHMGNTLEGEGEANKEPEEPGGVPAGQGWSDRGRDRFWLRGVNDQFWKGTKEEAIEWVISCFADKEREALRSTMPHSSLIPLHLTSPSTPSSSSLTFFQISSPRHLHERERPHERRDGSDPTARHLSVNMSGIMSPIGSKKDRVCYFFDSGQTFRSSSVQRSNR